MGLGISHRRAKKMAKDFIRRHPRLRLLQTCGRTFVVTPSPNFACARFWSYTVVAADHPHLQRLIAEGRQ